MAVFPSATVLAMFEDTVKIMQNTCALLASQPRTGKRPARITSLQCHYLVSVVIDYRRS